MAWHLGPPFRERLRGEGAEQHGAGWRRSRIQYVGSTLDSLTVSIDTTAVLYVSLGLLAVMLVCVAISCIPMLRKSPRSLSELR